MFFDGFDDFSLGDFDDDLFIMRKEPKNKDISCPKCSQHLSDLNETLFVGCPECYSIFAPYIRELALRYHGKCEHVGKVIDSAKNKAKIEKEIEELSKEEKNAVVNREYLKAEEIKRKIQSLRGQC